MAVLLPGKAVLRREGQAAEGFCEELRRVAALDGTAAAHDEGAAVEMQNYCRFLVFEVCGRGEGAVVPHTADARGLHELVLVQDSAVEIGAAGVDNEESVAIFACGEGFVGVVFYAGTEAPGVVEEEIAQGLSEGPGGAGTQEGKDVVE